MGEGRQTMKKNICGGGLIQQSRLDDVGAH